MASGRPDFHPTMLLEGKHDTELIPVLVDANGQLYIVMTGQAIAVNNLASDYFKAGEAVTVPGGVGVVNLPSDYFKAGEAIGQSNVGVVNLPSDYYKAGQAVGSVTANVNVAQTEKDRDMIGLDTTTRRQIAVDAAGIILARLKGAYGATLKDIAVDDTGILLSRMKGAYGAVLKDIAIDANGVLIARMKGTYAGNLLDVYVDESGYMMARMKGWDGGAPQDILTDVSGHMLARMQGYDGAALQDVKVDSSGYMLAKMMGLEGANLRVVAVDANGIMKANLSAQDLAYLKVRPTYGQIRRLFVGAQNVAHLEEITIHDVTGKGATTGGYVYSYYGGVQDNVEIRIYTDGVLAYQESFKTAYDRYPKGGLSPLLSCTLYQRDDGWFIGNIQPATTFETSLQIKVYNPYAFTIQIISVLYYALVP